MEKRFIRIGAFENATEGQCPVTAEEISLWRDAEHDVLFLVPKLKNEYEKGAVTSLTVGYVARGSKEESESDYRIEITEGGEFGAIFGEDQVITLESAECDSGYFYIEKVEFSDGEIWQESKEEAEKEEETPDVTMVKTIGGFGPEGPLLRKVPLSKIIAQRMTTQFVTTIIAVIGCVWNMVKCILALRMSNEALVESLAKIVVEYEFFGAKTVDDAVRILTENGTAGQIRTMYWLTAILFGATILFLVYTVHYFSENRRRLRTSIVTDSSLAVVVKKIKTLSIAELVLCCLCNFNFFGIFAGISGLSLASLHKRVMKSKKSKEVPQI